MDDSVPKRVMKSADREITPAWVLQRIGRHAYERALEDTRNRQENLVAAQLMCALTLEGVLNHVGRELFMDDMPEPQLWAAVERLHPKAKLLAIAERARFSIDFGSMPFQDFGPIFVFRRQLVHAKSDRLVVTDIPPEAVDDDGSLLEHLVPGLHADWELSCSLDTAARWRESVDQMASALCEATDCINCLIVGFSTGWSSEWER